MDMGFKIVDQKKFFISVVVALTILFLLFGVKDMEQRIAFASAIGTIVAAYAAWQAAREAAKSAKIARESMDATKALGLETLKETQMANQRTAFESRYTMLLAHHDHYHQQLCDYLDTYWQHNNELETPDVDKLQIEEIENFFSKSIYAENPNDCFSFLTGHQIISRYMRVLYHLLKFVYENANFNQNKKIRFQKNYTSPVRSTIRNDILLLIAINALNVRSQGAKNSSYPLYQKMLHNFSFFEHAIFMFPSKPNSLFSRDNWKKQVQDQVIISQSDFSTKLSSQMDDTNPHFRIPKVRLISPLIMVLYIFDNPMREEVLKALDSLGLRWEVNDQVIEKIENAKERVQHAVQFVEQIPSCRYQSSSYSGWNKITEEILSDIEKNTFRTACNSDAYKFEMVNDGKIMPLEGKLVRDHLGTFKRSQDILEQYKTYNGAEGYADYLVRLHNETINNSLNEIESYNVRSAQYAALQSEIPEGE